MTTVLLVRHGHTDAAGRRLTGRQRGVHLNEGGRREAERLVERLRDIPIATIVTSPLERCRETAAPLARSRSIAPRVDRRLLEVDYGDWTGRPLTQLRRTRLWRSIQHVPSTVRFPGGESMLEVQARMLDAVTAVGKAHPEGTVVLVSHADPIRLLVAHLAGMHADHLQRLSIDTASVTAVALGSGIPRVLKVNDTGDLSALVPPPRASRRKVGG